MKRYLAALLLLLTLPLLTLPAFAQPVNMPLTAMDGSKDNLSRYQGKWLVVNYWATWCPPCIVEMPELQSFHDQHVDSDAMVIGINAEDIGQQRLQTFLEDYFITYPVFMAGPTQQSELGLIPGLPTTFLVTPDGQVVARQVGAVTREMIEQFIQKWQPK
jgi:thiol-disulfide isomerase/thioredoxin